MKKIVLIITLLVGTFSYAQQELKLNVGGALVIKSLEFSYESYLTEDSSYGVSALFNLAKQSANFRYNENFMLTPYYRYYFATKGQFHLFGEGFLGINSGKKESIKNSDDYDVKYTDGALGVAVGAKYIGTSGITLDVYGGIGRNLFSSDSPALVPRIGLNVGYRF